MLSNLTKYTNLIYRIFSSIIGGVLIIYCIYLSRWSFLIMFMLLLLFSLNEFYQLFKYKKYRLHKGFGMGIGCAFFLALLLVLGNYIHSHILFVFFPLIILFLIIKLYDKLDKHPFLSSSFFYLGLVYIAIPFCCVNFLVFSDTIYSGNLLIGLLLLLWVNDIGAFFFGSIFGKKSLFKRISPKKTWEGLIGGLFSTMIISIFIAHLIQDILLWKWLFLSVIVGLGATFGDLVESQLKRSLLIKDSGSSIPGHGGFLDRFDGFMIIIPLTVACWKLFLQ